MVLRTILYQLKSKSISLATPTVYALSIELFTTLALGNDEKIVYSNITVNKCKYHRVCIAWFIAWPCNIGFITCYVLDTLFFAGEALA